jgi:hypothetical protein
VISCNSGELLLSDFIRLDCTLPISGIFAMVASTEPRSATEEPACGVPRKKIDVTDVRILE